MTVRAASAIAIVCTVGWLATSHAWAAEAASAPAEKEQATAEKEKAAQEKEKAAQEKEHAAKEKERAAQKKEMPGEKMKDQPIGPDMSAKRIVGALDELLAGVVKLDESRDLPPDMVREHVARLANSARSLRGVLERVAAATGGKFEFAPDRPRGETATRDLEGVMEDVKRELSNLERSDAPRNPEMEKRIDALRNRKREVAEKLERVRASMGPMGPGGPMRPDGPMPKLDIIRVEHVDAPYLAGMIREFLPPGSQVVPDTRTGRIVISTSDAGWDRARMIARELDVPSDRRGLDMPRAEGPRREGAPDRPYGYEAPRGDRGGQPDRPRDSEQRPDGPRARRTVGVVVELGDLFVTVRPDGSDDKLTVRAPMVMRDNGERAPDQRVVRQLGALQQGARVVVEWAEIEGSGVIQGVVPAPEGERR